MKRVFLISCRTLLGRGVENLLRQVPGLDVAICETEDVDQAMDQLKQFAPHVVLLGTGDPTHDATPAMVVRIMKEGIGAKIIGLNLRDNTICVYRGERRVVKDVEDLVEAIAQNEAQSEPVTAEEWAALAASRSRVYGFLAAVYNRMPDAAFAQSLSGPDMVGLLASMADREDLPAAMRAGVGLIEEFIAASQGRPVEELQTELAVDRTRLLRGVQPGYGPPPPYESVYAGAEGKPLMQASVAVRKVYAEAGVGVPEEVRDQPDFIGFELDFMRHLTAAEAQAWSEGGREEALQVLDKERAFLEGHIVRWIPRFCDVMDKEARLGFYQGIAKMTKGFVLDEGQKVAQFLKYARAAEAG